MAARPRLVLMIDNEPDFLLFMRELLQDEGHRVHTADSVEAAREEIAASRPDVIISDLLLWGDDPIAVGRMLATDPQMTGIPILICSAAARALEGLEIMTRPGGLELVTKPFSIDDLLRRLERLIDAGDELGLSGGSMD